MFQTFAFFKKSLRYCDESNLMKHSETECAQGLESKCKGQNIIEPIDHIKHAPPNKEYKGYEYVIDKEYILDDVEYEPTIDFPPVDLTEAQSIDTNELNHPPFSKTYEQNQSLDKDIFLYNNVSKYLYFYKSHKKITCKKLLTSKGIYIYESIVDILN